MNFTRNPITVTLAQSANSTQPNYQLHLEARMQATEGTGDYVKVLAQQLPPDSTGSATFYVQEAFRAGFAMHLPSLTASTITPATGIHRTAELYAGEIYGTSTSLSGVALNASLTLINGGLSKRSHAQLNYFTTHQADNSASKKFLTWHPASKKVVHPTAPEFLYFIVNSSITTLQRIVTVYFTDGTSTTLTTSYTPGITTGIGIVAIPAGYTSAGVSTADPAKTVLHYTVHMHNLENLTIISETRTYQVDHNQHPYTRQFAFLNSLGATDFIRTYGKATHSARFGRDTARAQLTAGYASTTPEVVVSNATQTQEMSISTGFVNKETAEYYTDLLRSTQVYEIVNGTYLPIVINTRSHRIAQDGTDKWYARFAYQYAYTDTQFNPA